MTYEEFAENIHRTGMYETVYTDSEGREILVIRMLCAYALMSPSPREWIGLTDDELYEIVRAEGKVLKADAWEIVEKLQAKLKEKNT